jgi:hypothetical protein
MIERCFQLGDGRVRVDLDRNAVNGDGRHTR